MRVDFAVDVERVVARAKRAADAKFLQVHCLGLVGCFFLDLGPEAV